jgi:hypothetical protein
VKHRDKSREDNGTHMYEYQRERKMRTGAGEAVEQTYKYRKENRRIEKVTVSYR